MKITKITKKIILITIILMSLISTFSFAAVVTSDKINLNVVEKNICTIKSITGTTLKTAVRLL